MSHAKTARAPGAASTPDAIHLQSRQQMAQAIVAMEQAGEGFRAPLLRAAAAGRITVAMASSGQTVPKRFLASSRPTVVLLADDTPDATGPGRWQQATSLIRWARSVILHGTGGEAMHYELAAVSAEMARRVLFVEMEQQHHAAWLDLAKRLAPRLPVLSIVPPPGQAHPDYAMARGGVLQ